MKRYLPFAALLTVALLVGCSGDSPRPSPVPTVAPDAWSITALTASSTGPFIDTVILIEATVTKNGSPAPDDTAVAFEASGGAFSSGTLEATVLTEDGVASVAYTAVAADDYVIRARVEGVSREIVVSYQDRATTDELQLFGINPRRGSYAGGEEVQISGKGILAPVDVFFDLGGVAYKAIVAAVVESDPPSETGAVTVITPAFTGANNSIQQAADVRLVANAGTGSQESDTLLQAFVLVPGGGPIIFGVSPNSGRSSGGEVVNILGQGFGTVASDISVSFTDPDAATRLGTVLAVAPDGSQVQVETPLFSTVPLTEDSPQDVTVSTLDGTVSLEDAFIVLADNPEPQIASISPLAGPLDGGTLVSIFGSGFQVPMQVTFGVLEATDVNVFNDTSPADQDRITCVSPDYSQQGDTPPVAVDVTVRNLESGLSDSFASFTYGDNLFISGNTPDEVRAGDLVIIYGSGFEDPLQVFLNDIQLEVVSVSGTELVVRVPEELAVECADTSGSFRVVLLESNLEVTGGNLTVRGNTPIVLSVDPVIYQEGDPADNPSGDTGLLSPTDMTINGLYFAENLQVQIETYRVPSSQVTVQSETTIDVSLLNVERGDILSSFQTGPCITDTGEEGTRNVATEASVQVSNLPGFCSASLNGAFIIEPSDRTCVVAFPELSVSPTSLQNFGTTNGATRDFIVRNLGTGPMTFAASIENEMNGGVFSVAPSSGTVQPNGLATVTVTFTFGSTSSSHSADLRIEALEDNALNSPVIINLQAETVIAP